jgi:hypothetical protein
MRIMIFSKMFLVSVARGATAGLSSSERMTVRLASRAINNRDNAASLFVCLMISFILCGVTIVSAQSPQAVPIEGKPFQADLTAVDAKWQLTFQTDGSPRALPAAELVRWGSFAEPGNCPLVVMADGGLIAADPSASAIVQSDQETVTFDSKSFSRLSMPVELLAGIVFHPPAGRRDRDVLLDRVLGAKGNADRLILENGDELSGSIDSIARNRIVLRSETGPANVEIGQIVALVLNPSLRKKAEKPPLWAWAGFTDGSRLPVRQLADASGLLTAVMLLGPTCKTVPQNLAAIQPLGGRATYLSDLEPAEYQQTPFLDIAWPYRSDRNATGGFLRCGGRLYLKGLGVHGKSRLTYVLDGRPARFDAELGVDDEAAGRGSALFRVLLDGREKYSGKTVRGGDPPVPISIDVTGGKRLDLIVEYADGADVLDHADWLDARLTR